MVSEQNLILLGTLKIKNVAPLFRFLVHCLHLKTLWNNLTFCKIRSATNNKDLTLGNWGIFQWWKLTSPFDKLLLCTCRCRTDVKFWYVLHFIFSWNVLVTNSITVNAIKTYLFFCIRCYCIGRNMRKLKKNTEREQKRKQWNRENLMMSSERWGFLKSVDWLIGECIVDV